MKKNDPNNFVPTEEDIEAFKKLLSETYLDPNMVIIWGHDWDKILQDAYSKEKICDNCKFFQKSNKQSDGTYDGFCELIAWGTTPDNKLRATLTDPASLMVSPDFGCNMWKGEKNDITA